MFIELLAKMNKEELESNKDKILSSVDILDNENKIHVYEYFQKKLLKYNEEINKEDLLLESIKNINNKKIKTKKGTLIKNI